MAPINSRSISGPVSQSSPSSPTRKRTRSSVSPTPSSELLGHGPVFPRLTPPFSLSTSDTMAANIDTYKSHSAAGNSLSLPIPNAPSLNFDCAGLSGHPMSTTRRSGLNALGWRQMLAANVQVRFDTGVVDMVGTPCTSTGYSLPGTVTLTLPGIPSNFESRYRLLKDLIVIVEAQTEYWDSNGRYTPLRLFASALPLIPKGKPELIPPFSYNLNHTDIHLEFPFDLRLPGWLPPSLLSTYTSVTYGVEASAQVGWSEMSIFPCGSPYLSPCLSDVSTTRSQFTTFAVRRHRVPTALNPSATIRQRIFHRDRFCTQLGRKLEFEIGLPDWIDIHADSLDLSLRLHVAGEKVVKAVTRTESPLVESQEAQPSETTATTIDAADVSTSTSASSSISSRTKDESDYMTSIVELGMDIEEMGLFSSQPLGPYMAMFPIPHEQPNSKHKSYPLLGPTSCPPSLDHPLVPRDNSPFQRILHRRCLLSDDGTQRRYRFSRPGKGLDTSWRRIRFVLPMPNSGASDVPPGSEPSRAQQTLPIPDSDSPFLRLKHKLNIRVVLKTPGFDEPETLLLETPIRFGSQPETLPKPSSASPPPYVSIYHENGEPRDCDPLPLYPGTPATTPTEVETDMSELSLQPTAVLPPTLPSIVAAEATSPGSRGEFRENCSHDPDARSTPDLDIPSSSSSPNPSPTPSPSPRTSKLPTEEWSFSGEGNTQT